MRSSREFIVEVSLPELGACEVLEVYFDNYDIPVATSKEDADNTLFFRLPYDLLPDYRKGRTVLMADLEDEGRLVFYHYPHDYEDTWGNEEVTRIEWKHETRELHELLPDFL